MPLKKKSQIKFIIVNTWNLLQKKQPSEQVRSSRQSKSEAAVKTTRTSTTKRADTWEERLQDRPIILLDNWTKETSSKSKACSSFREYQATKKLKSKNCSTIQNTAATTATATNTASTPTASASTPLKIRALIDLDRIYKASSLIDREKKSPVYNSSKSPTRHHTNTNEEVLNNEQFLEGLNEHALRSPEDVTSQIQKCSVVLRRCDESTLAASTKSQVNV